MSPDDNAGGLSNSFFPSPMKNLLDITNDQAMYVLCVARNRIGLHPNSNRILCVHACFRSATFFNPEAVNPTPRLLSNVRVPDKVCS